MKYMYPQVVKLHPDILEYLPDLQGKTGNERFPERDFFFKVLNKLYPATFQQIVKEANEVRCPQKQNLQEQQW